MSTCEPLCAILLSRAGQGPGEAVCTKTRRFTRDERESEGRKRKQEKALALSVRQGGYFCPQCGQLRRRKLTLF